ncbi:MAG TPA: hypothetical protein VKS20_09065 [Candidatus Acidoferrales bacterium]|nr:hypothetical protein [Candidatus Acidoferrales bacterium]
MFFVKLLDVSTAKTSRSIRGGLSFNQTSPEGQNSDGNQLVTCAKAAKLRYSRDKREAREKEGDIKIEKEDLAIPDGSATQAPPLAGYGVLPGR